MYLINLFMSQQEIFEKMYLKNYKMFYENLMKYASTVFHKLRPNVNVPWNIMHGTTGIASGWKPHLRAFYWYNNELSTLIRIRVIRILVNQNVGKFKENLNFKMQ
jgi:hypothetical protein